jgi:hypothetical protein
MGGGGVWRRVDAKLGEQVRRWWWFGGAERDVEGSFISCEEGLLGR